ncbi:hypothetical protein FOA52_009191 [Chlamydomonas sp. UWO 241]|nr:hypothetical protein FOA52_009191 [Chlamydomonas sp. UWO 241]
MVAHPCTMRSPVGTTRVGTTTSGNRGMSSAVDDVLFSLDLLPSVIWPSLDQDAKRAFRRVSGVARARADACVAVATVVSGQRWGETLDLLDLTPIASLPNLTTLSMAGTRVSDLTPLHAVAAKLVTLDISGCVYVTSLVPLASLANLVTLDMTGVANVTRRPWRRSRPWPSWSR